MEIPVYEAEESPCRAYVIQRRTKETRISVDLCLEGGEIRISTGIGFFDHMLTAFAFYGGLGLKIEAEGDLEVDGHHTVEDTGIVLGQALNRALGDRKGLRRFASACIPMDEALCFTVLDFSNRPFLVFDADMPQPMIGTYDPCLTEEFLRALAVNSGLTLHMKCLYGKNAHHITEALFKSLGAAVKEAVQITGTGVTSTKGAVMGTVAIVDYGVGNLKSVANALSYLGCSSCITADPAELERADAIILPGVGAFPDAADRLRSGGLDQHVLAQGQKKPVLGICLGMQLLLEQGREVRPCPGLGVIRGTVDRIPTQSKLPHIGWNSLRFFHHSPLFRGLDEGAYVYFVHSFSAQDTDPAQVIAATDYGPAVTAAVSSGNFYGTQFHPEKSGEVGLTILRNFAGLNC